MIAELFDKIKNTTSSKEKIALLKSYENQELLHKILEYTYNYRIIFGITANSIKLPFSVLTSTTEDFPVKLFDQILNTKGRNAKIELIETELRKVGGKTASYLLKALDKDLGIGINTKNINKAFEDLLPEFLLMLAQPESKEKFNSHFTNCNEVIVQLKIDGIRCIVDCSGTEVKFYTRGGFEVQEFLIENIKKEIMSDYKKFAGYTFDGEIYTSHFQDLMKIVQRKKVNDVAMKIRNTCKLALFDVVSLSQKQLQRLETLKSLNLQGNYIKILPYALFKYDYALLKAYAEKLIKQGHEGIIVKHPFGLYENKRSYSWMKFKGVDTVDLKILGTFEGEGKYVGMLGGLTLQLPNNNTVNCGTGFSDPERTELWKQRDSLIGKYAEIKFMQETKDESLRHPVFIRIRYDIKGEKEL